MDFAKHMFILLLSLFCLCACHKETKKPSFQQFVSELKQTAIAKGISAKTVNQYMNHLKAPIEKSIHDLHHQAQKVLSFSEYRDNLVNQHRIQRGKILLKRYRPLLINIEKKYGVQPPFIMAIWGIETDYGHDMGKAPLISSLVTLAYQHHRSDFYRQQVLAALTILDKHYHFKAQQLSTWDGGMGQPSFEPSTYLNYAVDYDNSGFADIWNSVPDAFASIAHFLQKNGWQRHETWGCIVRLTKFIPRKMLNIHHQRSIQDWEKLGVKPLAPLTATEMKNRAALLIPEGENHPAYLVFHNFNVLLAWNDTTFEALSIGLLSDNIDTVRPEEAAQQSSRRV